MTTVQLLIGPICCPLHVSDVAENGGASPEVVSVGVATSPVLVMTQLSVAVWPTSTPPKEDMTVEGESAAGFCATPVSLSIAMPPCVALAVKVPVFEPLGAAAVN
jgi:hypothetical protein